MFVGMQRLVLQIPGARSVKDRRRVVRSFKDRLQAKLRVSVAEVGDSDNHSCAVIAMAVVSNSTAVCDEVMAYAATMASTLPDAVLADRATEVVSLGYGGSGLRGGIEQLWSGDSLRAGPDDYQEDDDQEGDDSEGQR